MAAKMYNGVNEIRLQKTRISGLGFANTNPVGPACWRVIDMHDGRAAAVGPLYNSKAELLADFDRYAKTWGY